jgi:hypothetical protein
MKAIKNLRTCRKGHHYYKSSDCPVCPFCEAERKPVQGFLSELVAPARRALMSIGATTLRKLSKHTEEEISDLHGMGPSTIPKLRSALKMEGLAFKRSE